ncbi:hypothetical protein [Spirilliplanes yamanashiensis]|uniref:Uncharacterized protein n=1 Tax=Spirilliplanes yamanashiensis TaxID=42233 RepID=A0A8J4DK01_9ACTN|nr:hypothetical protein [Spirilliplanes yamanashiensis]MDP9815585.1 phosphoglycerol transferase MdoB-like AlkP superfamily enzyme [Spirilliplanes yamanashiensis]GIJ03839.1 hypothetical protein Sya03_31910 [Spirilliplanes yamanashiensis]
MNLGRQPRGRRGDFDRPYSALTLRLWLAVFGLVACAVLAVLSWRADLDGMAWVLVVLAVVAAGDIVVVQLRRHAR